MAPVLVAAALLGLVVGSFVNVVIHRLPRGESLLRPRSCCPRCGVAIGAWRNVPVLSWLILRGRCGGCAGSISVRYPLVELATAVLFGAVTARFGLVPALPAYLYLAAVAVALAMIDIDVHRLPDRIVLPSYAVAGLLLAPAVAAGGDWWAAGRALAAMAALWCGFFLVATAYPGGMGFGDVKLAGLLGLFLGWLGWGSVLVGTFAGFFFGAVVGVVLMAMGRAGRRSPVPFGPFLLAGALLAVFAADPLAAWYVSGFGGA
jgi:leader peptidase (prepilin peptidase) / N-methyltransferase